MRRDVSVILLYRADGRVLLQHRSEDAERMPGHWAFFGGGIEAGETPDEALKREVLEELSWHITNARLLFSDSLEPFGFETLVHLYAEVCEDVSTLVLGEGQGWGWFNLAEAKELKMSAWDRTMLERAYPMIFPQQSL